MDFTGGIDFRAVLGRSDVICESCKWKSGLKGDTQNWYFVTKIVLTYCEKKLLKFEPEGQEFAKFLRSLE